MDIYIIIYQTYSWIKKATPAYMYVYMQGT